MCHGHSAEWKWHSGPCLWMIMWQIVVLLSHWDQLSQSEPVEHSGHWKLLRSVDTSASHTPPHRPLHPIPILSWWPYQPLAPAHMAPHVARRHPTLSVLGAALSAAESVFHSKSAVVLKQYEQQVTIRYRFSLFESFVCKSKSLLTARSINIGIFVRRFIVVHSWVQYYHLWLKTTVYVFFNQN